jgi:hypothetical protein
MTKTERLQNFYPGIAVWPEFDDAILGITYEFQFDLPRVVYDYGRILSIIQKQSDCEDKFDASDWFEYNYTNSTEPYVAGSDGPHPILLDRLFGIEFYEPSDNPNSK